MGLYLASEAKELREELLPCDEELAPTVMFIILCVSRCLMPGVFGVCGRSYECLLWGSEGSREIPVMLGLVECAFRGHWY